MKATVTVLSPSDVCWFRYIDKSSYLSSIFQVLFFIKLYFSYCCWWIYKNKAYKSFDWENLICPKSYLNFEFTSWFLKFWGIKTRYIYTFSLERMKKIKIVYLDSILSQTAFKFHYHWPHFSVLGPFFRDESNRLCKQHVGQIFFAQILPLMRSRKEEFPGRNKNSHSFLRIIECDTPILEYF